MACSHEHHKHNHDKELERGQEFSLYQHVDTTKVFCLNEKEKGSVKNVFKPWDERLNTEKFLESCDDEELILHIPFTGVLKLKSIMVVGGENGKSPKKMKIFTNRDDIDFTNVKEIKPIQEWDLSEDIQGQLEYPTKMAKFNNVYSITIYFPQNFGNDVTRIYYLGLKGEYSAPYKREAVVTSYESKPQLKDHKNPTGETMSRQIQ